MTADAGPGGLRVAALYASLALFWGSTFLWVEIALESTGPLVISGLRLAVGAAVIWGLVALKGAQVRREHAWPVLRPWVGRGIVLGILATGLPGVLLGFAQQGISSGTAAIFNATAPLWTVVIGLLAARGAREHRPGPVTLAGLVIGLVGVGVLVGQAPSAAELEGQFLVVALAVVYASGGVYAQRRFGDAPPFAAALLCSAAAAALVLPFGVAGWIADPPAPGALVAIGALGVTSSGLAYLFYFELLRGLGATRTLTVTYLAPVVAVVLGVVVLGEEVLPLQLAGLGLILLGVAGVNGQLPLGRRRRQAASDRRAPRGAGAEPGPRQEKPCPTLR